MMKVKILFLIGVLTLAGCTGGGDADEDLPATATLAPIVSFTPRLTATPFATLTPLPTFTYTPSITPIPPTATETPVPSPTPQITGIISSLQTVNIRQGPGTTFSAFVALNPGTGVIVLGQNGDGSWYEVELEDGDRGWVSAALVRLQPTPSPIPTFTVTPDLTALALGTPLPTAVLGGGTVTPTPPRAAVTATPVGTDDPGEVDADADGVAVAAETTATESFLPIRDVTALYQTATALAGGFSPPTPRPNPQATASPTGQSPNIPAPVVTGATSTPPAVTPVSSGNTRVQQGVDVFALCNNEALGVSAPTNLAPGSTIDIYWAWIMSDDQYLAQHLDAVNYEIRINDELLNWRQFGTPVQQEGNNAVKYWFVPYGPLDSGDYLITYRATWNEPIFDGFEMFGPGTRNPVEEGSCTFTVR